MTQIDLIEGELVDLEAKSKYTLALIAGLDGDPTAWEYRDECLDGGGSEAECACGHPIRWCFPVYRRVADGSERMKIVGSTCVRHFAEVSPETGLRMVAALDALEKRLAEAERDARAAARAVEVEAARAEFERDYAAMHARYATYRRGDAPWDLWAKCASSKWRVPRDAPEYSRGADYVRWYRKHAEICRKAGVGNQNQILS